MVQGWHTAWVPPVEKVPGGQSSHTVSCHSVPEEQECLGEGSTGASPPLRLGAGLWALYLHRVLWLTCLLHPLAQAAGTVGPALSTTVPILLHTEVALVAATHGVPPTIALLPGHLAHAWDPREGAQRNSKDCHGWW